MDEVKGLSALKNLVKLDLIENPVCNDEGYKREAIFEAIPTLDVLDYMHKSGEEYESDDDEYDDEGLLFGEGGEEEIEQLKAQLSEEQLDELKKRGITPEEYILGMGDDLFDEEGEEENEEQDGDKDGDAEKKPE